MWGRRSEADRLATVLQAHDDEGRRDEKEVRATYLSVIRRKPDRIGCFAAARLEELDGDVAEAEEARVRDQYLSAAALDEDELSERALCALADLMTRHGKPGMASGPLGHVASRGGPRAAWARERLDELEAAPLTRRPDSGEPCCSLCRGTVEQVGELDAGDGANICAGCAGIVADAAAKRETAPGLESSTRRCDFCGVTYPAGNGVATPFTLAWICYGCGERSAARLAR